MNLRKKESMTAKENMREFLGKEMTKQRQTSEEQSTMNKCFFIGERVAVSRHIDQLLKPETTIRASVGIVRGVCQTAKGISGSEISYKVVFQGAVYDDFLIFNDGSGEFSLISESKYDIRRINTEELGSEFEQTVKAEFELIKALTENTDETKRAVTLTSLRNLTRYLSDEINIEYKKIEELAKGVCIEERAAVLATLKNLSEYLKSKREKK